MKKLLFIILATLVFALPGQAQGWVGLSSNKLTPVVQEQSQWCWAASSQFIYFVYGVAPTQASLVLRVHGNTDNLPGSDSDITYTLNGWAQQSDGTKTIVHAAEVPGMVTPQVLYDNLRNGQPVLVATVTSPSTGHAVVVTSAFFFQGPNGLTVSGLVYRDPWPSPENKANGGRVQVSGDDLVHFVSSVRSSWVTWVTRQ